MNVIWHDDEGMHVYCALVLKETMIEGECPRVFMKNKLSTGAEAYKITCTVFLNVRQVSTIEAHLPKLRLFENYVPLKEFGSAAAPGCVFASLYSILKGGPQ